MQADLPNLSSVDASRDPGGQAPSDTGEQIQKQDQLLAKASAIRSLRATLAFAGKGTWPEPQHGTDHWANLLKEANWLAKDFVQVATPLHINACSFLLSQGKQKICQTACL